MAYNDTPESIKQNKDPVIELTIQKCTLGSRLLVLRVTRKIPYPGVGIIKMIPFQEHVSVLKNI